MLCLAGINWRNVSQPFSSQPFSTSQKVQKLDLAMLYISFSPAAGPAGQLVRPDPTLGPVVGAHPPPNPRSIRYLNTPLVREGVHNQQWMDNNRLLTFTALHSSSQPLALLWAVASASLLMFCRGCRNIKHAESGGRVWLLGTRNQKKCCTWESGTKNL